MKAERWIAAAAISVGAHAAFAAWVEGPAPHHAAAARPPIEMELAAIAPPPPPPLPPEVDPPPPGATKPIVVKHVAKRPPRPAAAPPPAPKLGIDEDTSAARSSFEVQAGTPTGEIDGVGKDPAPPPPTPEVKPVPAAGLPARKFVPIFEVTQLPRPRHAVQPEVPEAFRQAQREALVVVEVEIDAHGHVIGARVMKHAEFGLDDAAVAAAKATEFEPALMGLQPVAVRYQMPYRFRVRG